MTTLFEFVSARSTSNSALPLPVHDHMVCALARIVDLVNRQTPTNANIAQFSFAGKKSGKRTPSSSDISDDPACPDLTISRSVNADEPRRYGLVIEYPGELDCRLWPAAARHKCRSRFTAIMTPAWTPRLDPSWVTSCSSQEGRSR